MDCLDQIDALHSCITHHQGADLLVLDNCIVLLMRLVCDRRRGQQPAAQHIMELGLPAMLLQAVNHWWVGCGGLGKEAGSAGILRGVRV